MDVTKSHHPNSMILASAKLEITKSPVTIYTAKKDWSLENLLDLGLARGVKISFESSKIDIKADNGTVPIKGLTDVKAKVEFSLLERHLPDIAVAMAGLVNVKKIDGEDEKNILISNVPVIATLDEYEYVQLYVTQGFESDDFGRGGNRDFIVTGLGTKTDGCDTGFTKDNNKLEDGMFAFYKNGRLYIDNSDIFLKRLLEIDGKYSSEDKLKEALLEKKKKNQWVGVALGSSEFVCAITLSATPTVYQLTKGSGGIAQPIAMKLTNKRKADDGRIITRTFELPYGFYTGDDSITLKSKNDTDNIAEIPMSFEFTPHPDMVDDNELSEMSLYREVAEL